MSTLFNLKAVPGLDMICSTASFGILIHASSSSGHAEKWKTGNRPWLSKSQHVTRVARVLWHWHLMRGTLFEIHQLHSIDVYCTPWIHSLLDPYGSKTRVSRRDILTITIGVHIFYYTATWEVGGNFQIESYFYSKFGRLSIQFINATNTQPNFTS